MPFFPSLQDPKILDKVTKKNGKDIPELDKRSLTICSNTDYINITYHHVICPDAATAKVNNRLRSGREKRERLEFSLSYFVGHATII